MTHTFRIHDDAAPARIAQDFLTDAKAIVSRKSDSYARAPAERAFVHTVFCYTDVVLRKALDPENSPGSRALAAACAAPALGAGLLALATLVPVFLANDYLSTARRVEVSGLHNQRRALRTRITAFDRALKNPGIRWEQLSHKQQEAALAECREAARLLHTHGPSLGMRHPAKGVEKQLKTWRAKCYETKQPERPCTVMASAPTLPEAYEAHARQGGFSAPG